MKVFSNCIVVLEFDAATSYKDKAAWRKKISDNGGVISYILTRKVNIKQTFACAFFYLFYAGRRAHSNYTVRLVF